MNGNLQTVEVINPRDRDRRLEQLLHKYHSSRRNRVIVFVLYKKVVSCSAEPPDPAATQTSLLSSITSLRTHLLFRTLLCWLSARLLLSLDGMLNMLQD